MRRLTLLAAASVLGAAFAGAPALAQPAPVQPMQTAPVGPGPETFTAEDAAAVLDARLVALKTVLKLTPDQEKLWPPVEGAIRDAVKGAIARREAREAAPPPDNVLDLLGQVAEAEQARGKALGAFVTAAKPFFASLTPAQVNRIPAFLGLQDPGGPSASTELWIFEDEQ